MTTFEITELSLLAIIAFMLVVIFVYVCWHFRAVESCQRRTFNEISRIHNNTSICSHFVEHHISPDLEMVSADVPLIREYLNNINQLIEKMGNKAQPILIPYYDNADEKIKIEPLTNPLGGWPPCYIGGPCTNPHHDCINCPRPNTDGTWITSTNLKQNNEDKV